MSDQEREIRVHIRWTIRRDMPEIFEIEKGCFEFPWLEDDFIRCLRQRNCIGMVAEYEDLIVGFMIYELHKNRVHVLNFAVHPDYRRAGIGTQMVVKLKAKLSAQRALLGNEVIFINHVPQKEVRSIQMSSDCLLFLGHYGEGNKGVVSTKLFEYLFLNKYIIPFCIRENSDVDVIFSTLTGKTLRLNEEDEIFIFIKNLTSELDFHSNALKIQNIDSAKLLINDYNNFARQLVNV